jgi:Tfp pilus assembly protein PilZ
VTSDASTVSWIVPGYGTSRASGIGANFAVGDGGLLLFWGTIWAEAAEASNSATSATARITRIS